MITEERHATVSELQALRIEVTILKIAALQAQANTIAVEQRAAIEAARAEVDAPAEWRYNSTTRMFEP